MKSIDDIITHIKKNIVQTLLESITFDGINDTDRLIADLGLDSLDYAMIMLSGEEFIDKKINEDGIVWQEVQTVQQLAKLLYEQQDL
jgi:acyl carrier protein